MTADYPEAFTVDNLYQILDSNSVVADEFGHDNAERLVALARQRADSRGEQSALDSTETECIIGTDWTGFAGDEFGYDGGKMNKWAFGVCKEDISRGKDATLFTNVHVVQQDWLETGDDRKTKLEQYEDEDYENSEPGEMWIPDAAAQYIAIIALSDELIHGDATVADAM